MVSLLPVRLDDQTDGVVGQVVCGRERVIVQYLVVFIRADVKAIERDVRGIADFIIALRRFGEQCTGRRRVRTLPVAVDVAYAILDAGGGFVLGQVRSADEGSVAVINPVVGQGRDRGVRLAGVRVDQVREQAELGEIGAEVLDVVRSLEAVEAVQLQAQLVVPEEGELSASRGLGRGGIQLVKRILRLLLRLQEDLPALLGLHNDPDEGVHLVFRRAVALLGLGDLFFCHRTGGDQLVQHRLHRVAHGLDIGQEEGLAVKVHAELEAGKEERGHGLQREQAFAVLRDHPDIVLLQADDLFFAEAVTAADLVQ